MHGTNGIAQIDPGTIIRVLAGQNDHLGGRILGQLVESALHGLHHGHGPAIELLGIVHGHGGDAIVGRGYQ